MTDLSPTPSGHARPLIAAFLLLATILSGHCGPDAADLEAGAVQAIQAANVEMKRIGTDPSTYKLIEARKYLTPTNPLLGPNPESPYAKNIQASLVGKSYWLITYGPVPLKLGSSTAVFIEDRSWHPLAIHRGK